MISMTRLNLHILISQYTDKSRVTWYPPGRQTIIFQMGYYGGAGGGIQNEIEGISYGKNKSEKKDIKPHKV